MKIKIHLHNIKFFNLIKYINMFLSFCSDSCTNFWWLLKRTEVNDEPQYLSPLNSTTKYFFFFFNNQYK